MVFRLLGSYVLGLVFNNADAEVLDEQNGVDETSGSDGEVFTTYPSPSPVRCRRHS